MSKVQIMDHPLIQHKITYIRREEVGSKEFREIVGEIAALMCYEATRDLKVEDVKIKTPICEMDGKGIKRQEAGGGSHSPGGYRHGRRDPEHDPCGEGGPYRSVP